MVIIHRVMQQPRLEIAEHILDVCEEQMCLRIDKHCQPNSKILDVLIKPDMDDDEAQDRMLDPYDAECYLAEHGCTICRAGPGDFMMTDCETGHTAAGCKIDFLECVGLGGKRVGTFHTHPVGLPLPSHPDIMCSFNWKTSYDFVGGLVGGRKVIVCYTPRPTSEMKYGHLQGMCIFRDRVPIPNFPSGEPIGVIRFYREDPGPMASELLEDFDNIFPSDCYDEDQRHEFREDIKIGIIPDEFWESYECESEEDELKIFDNDAQRAGFEEQLRELSDTFDVMVRWC